MNPREEAREKVESLTNPEVAETIDRLVLMIDEMRLIMKEREEQDERPSPCRRRRRPGLDRN